MSDNATVTIDGISYDVDKLSEEARAIVESLRFVEQEIAQFQSRIAVLNTAKSAYMGSLAKELPKIPN